MAPDRHRRPPLGTIFRIGGGEEVISFSGRWDKRVHFDVVFEVLEDMGDPFACVVALSPTLPTYSGFEAGSLSAGRRDTSGIGLHPLLWK